jgi:CRP-like cAMP-binding protein
MATRAEIVAVAQSKGWLSRLPPDRQSAMLDVASVVHLDAGDVLFNVDDRAGRMFGLISGCVAAEAAQSDREPQKGLLLHAVTWFGEGGMSGRPSRLVGIRATRPTTLLAIEADGFRRVADRFPEIWRDLHALAVSHLGDVIGLAEDLMIRSSRDRLAAILVRLAGLRTEEPPDPPTIDATQAEIAAIANLSRSVVSDLLPKMEREGLVSLGRASVTILDADRLLASK